MSLLFTLTDYLTNRINLRIKFLQVSLMRVINSNNVSIISESKHIAKYKRFWENYM